MRVVVSTICCAVLGQSIGSAAEARHAPLDAAWAALDAPALRWFGPLRRLRDQLMIALFPRWPYRDGHPGYLRVVPFFRDDRRFRLWGGRIGAAVGRDDRTTLGSTEADLDSTFRFGAMVRVRASQATSRDDSGVSGLATGTYRLLQGPRALTRIGLGARWSTIGSSPGIGPAGSLAIAWFPRAPWILDIEADIGSVGARPVAAGEVGAGYMLRALELRAGFLWQSGCPAFHGPVGGISYWF